MSKSSIINFSSLLELSSQLYQSTDTEFILNSTLLSLMGKLIINKSIAFYKNIETSQFQILISKGNFYVSYDNFDNLDSFLIINPDNYPKLYEQKVHYLIPIKVDNQVVAVFLLGKSLIEHTLTEEEIIYINLLTNICGNALKNAVNIINSLKAKEKAERQNQLLKTLFEIGRDFSTFISREQIIKNLTLNIMGQLTVSRFAVYLIENDKYFNEIINRLDIRLPQTILEEFAATNIAERINDNLIKKYPNINTEIQIISPMKVKAQKKGIMLIGPKLSKLDFTENDILFIEALGNTAIAALENERLINEEIEKKKIESELNIALEIQKNLLPKSPPNLKNFILEGITIPSRYVGGDYYDFIKINDEKYLIVIADVSGKGIPASLIMSNLQATLQILAVSDYNILEIVQKTNELLCKNTSFDKFVTAFIAIIDDKNKEIEYINAGHNAPIYISNSKIKKLDTGGLLLGFLEDPPPYQSEKIKLGNDDLIVMFTDGVNEARNKNKQEYSDERLESIIFENRDKQAWEIKDTIIEDLKNFTRDCEQYDDITLITIKVN